MVRTSVLAVAFIAVVVPARAQPQVQPREPPAAAVPSHPPADAPHDSTSLRSLFTDLGADIRHLPSMENALILGAGGGLSLALHGEDADITRRFVASPAVEEVLEPGEALGDGVVQFGAAIGMYAVGRGVHNQRLALVGADLVRSQIVNTGLTQAIKFTVDRERPDGGHYSFPSGHTSSSFATATVLQRHFGWRAGIPAYGLAAFVGGSRLQENRHYLTDVIFGAALGIVSGRTTTMGRGTAAFSVTPFAVRRGGGVSVTLVRPRQQGWPTAGQRP
jgi:membrane-associated phospholipid phosphatase